jgi:hypothetical protein
MYFEMAKPGAYFVEGGAAFCNVAVFHKVQNLITADYSRVNLAAACVGVAALQTFQRLWTISLITTLWLHVMMPAAQHLNRSQLQLLKGKHWRNNLHYRRDVNSEIHVVPFATTFPCAPFPGYVVISVPACK